MLGYFGPYVKGANTTNLLIRCHNRFAVLAVSEITHGFRLPVRCPGLNGGRIHAILSPQFRPTKPPLSMSLGGANSLQYFCKLALLLLG